MKPFAYTCPDRWNSGPFLTLEAAVAALRSDGFSAYTASITEPILAHYADGTKDRPDLSPFITIRPLSPEDIAEMERQLDEAIAKSRVEYDEFMARWNKERPGERYVSFSGESWLFMNDRNDMLKRDFARKVTFWRDVPVNPLDHEQTK